MGRAVVTLGRVEPPTPSVRLGSTQAYPRGAGTVFRVLDLVRELKTKVGHTLVAITRTDAGISQPSRDRAAAHGIEIAGAIPADPEIRRRDEAGEPLPDVSADNPALAAVRELLGKAGVLRS